MLDTPVAQRSCLFCESDKVSFWYNHPSSYKNDTFSIYKCSSCRGAFVLPRPSEEYLSEFYNSESHSLDPSYNPGGLTSYIEELFAAERNFPNATVDAERMIHTATGLTRGKRFLDVGAGNGFFTNAARQAGLQCTAIELSEKSHDVFEGMDGFRPLHGSLNREFADRHGGQFDFVLLSQVLEHLPNLAETVAYIWQVLAPGGICVIAVPHFGSLVSKVQGKKDMFITPPEHINYFSMRGLKALFVDREFAVAHVDTISKFDRNKIYRKAKIRPAGLLISLVLDVSLYISDKIDRGMFINAYFRKSA